MLNLFKENGFGDAHISQIVRIHPLVLLFDHKKTLLPKIELLCSIGVLSFNSSYPFQWAIEKPPLAPRVAASHLRPPLQFIIIFLKKLS
jgi:hypothetical protein